MNSLVKQLEERDKEEKDKYSQFFADYGQCLEMIQQQKKQIDQLSKKHELNSDKSLLDVELINRIQTLQSELLISKQREVECLEEMKQLKKEHDIAIKSLHTTLKDMKEQQLEIESLRESIDRFRGILQQKEKEKHALKQELVKLRNLLDEQERTNRLLKKRLQQREDDLLLLKETMASTINQLTEELRGSGEEIIQVISQSEPAKRMDIDYCSGDFDTEDKECSFQPHFIKASETAISTVAVSESLHSFFSISGTEVRQWNPQTCSSQCIQSSLDEMECSWILPSPALHSSVHGSLIGSILDDGTLFVHHLSSTSSSFTLYPQSGMKLDLITMGSERLAITTGKKRVSLVDLESQHFLQSFLFDSSITTLSSTPDFYLLVTSHQDRSIRLWDARSGSIIQHIPKTHSSPIQSLSLVYRL
ncbi:hypothetical protein WA171_006329 [Blastocystis sp. BT1]